MSCKKLGPVDIADVSFTLCHSKLIRYAMNRTELLRQLRAHSPSDEREGRMLERIARFVKDNETCFDRNLRTGHLTGTEEESILRMIRKTTRLREGMEQFVPRSPFPPETQT